MADKQKKGFKWRNFSLIAYLLATAVGYLYATGYYGNFGIDILNYVEPVDFLLISLDNVDQVLKFSGLIVPFVLPLIILVLVVAILITLIIVLAILGAYLSLVLVLCSASLLILAVIAAVADRAKWVWQTLQATFGRQSDGRRAAEEDVQGAGGRRPASRADFRSKVSKVRRLVATYKKVAEADRSKEAKKKKFDYLTGAKEVTLEKVPKVWSWILQILRPIPDRTLKWIGGFFESESSWRPKGWTSLGRLRQLVVVGALAYVGCAAYVKGEVDAHKIRQLVANGEQSPKEAIDAANVDKTSSMFFRSVICPMMPWISCDHKDRLVATYAVPTANLATLELNECKERDKEGLKYVRANLRQDVGDGAHRAASDCHVYLGATGSMQFLAHFNTSEDNKQTEDQSGGGRNRPVVIVISDDEGQAADPLEVDARSAVVFDARSGTLSAQRCELELVALVGPFVTGSADIEENNDEEQRPAICEAPGRSRKELMGVGAAVNKLKASNFGTLVLVGRADIRPINNKEFDSNMDLIRERLAKVGERLKSHKNLSILRVPGGPMDWINPDDRCSRVVEVYACPTPTDTAEVTRGAGGEWQGEQKPSSNGVDNS